MARSHATANNTDALYNHLMFASKKLPCPVCSRMLNPVHLKRHIRWHEKDSVCKTCNTKIFGGKKFCNQSCAAIFNNAIPGRRQNKTNPCPNCNKPTQNAKFCCRKCQSSFYFNKKVNDWLQGLTTGNVSPDSVASFVKRWLWDRAGGKCEQCGWSKVNVYTGKIPLSVHHKDGNYENTVPNNLELLCGCCHSLTPTFGGANKGKGRIKRRTKRKLVAGNRSRT